MPHELLLLLVMLTSAVTAALWLVISKKRQWFDHPDKRSSHGVPTPTSGGIAMLAALALFAVVDDSAVRDWRGALAAAATVMLVLTGLIDDFFKLGIRIRLMLQAVAVAALWPLLLILPEWPVMAVVSVHGIVLALLLSIAILWLINLYNFMDGIDGLASMQAIFTGLALVTLMIVKGHALFSLVPLALVAAVAGFLAFNLPPARMFMGDVGSYLLAFFIAWMFLQQILAGAVGYWAPLILLGTFIVDSTTTLIGRLLAGAVWYHPHRSHAYQLLARRWSSHGRVVLLYAAINVVWLLPLAWLAESYPQQGVWLVLVAWLPLAVAVRRIRNIPIID